jgi:O-antigen/teichoic acid export membrane protein
MNTVAAGPGERTLRRPVVLSLAGKAAEAVTLVLLVTLVPRTLGPADYGLFGLALALVAIGSTASSLGGSSLVRLVAGASADERAALVRVLLTRAVRLRGAWALVLACTAAALALVDPSRFRLVVSLFVALAIVLDIGATLMFQLAVALDKIVWWSFRYPVQNAILVLGTLVLYETYGVNGAVAAIAVASAGSLVAGAAIVAPSIRSADGGGELSRSDMRFMRLQWLGGLFTLLTHRGGVVVVALLAGSATQTGYAALAIGGTVALIYVGLQIFLVSLPRLSALTVSASDRADAALRHLGWVTLATLAPISLVGAIVTTTGLARLVGAEFRDADTAIVAGLAVAPLIALTGMTGSATVMYVRPEARVWSTGAGAAVFAVVAVALVPSAGALGATVALLASTAVTAAAGLAFFPHLRDARLVAACVAASACTLLLGYLA